MGYSDHLRSLLRPLDIYNLSPGSLSNSELEALGRGLDGVSQRMDYVEKDRFGYIRIIFPNVAGIPEGFEQIRDIILDIIPCHLDVEFYFRYLTWEECEGYRYSWDIIHQREYTWYGFELAV